MSTLHRHHRDGGVACVVASACVLKVERGRVHADVASALPNVALVAGSIPLHGPCGAGRVSVVRNRNPILGAEAQIAHGGPVHVVVESDPRDGKAER